MSHYQLEEGGPGLALVHGRGGQHDASARTGNNGIMKRALVTPPRRTAHLADVALRGGKGRAPDGRRLTPGELDSLQTVARINAEVVATAQAVALAAHSQDVEWLIGQFMNPLNLAARRAPKLPNQDVVRRAILHIENTHDSKNREDLRRSLGRAVDAWFEAFRARRKHPEWKTVEGVPCTFAQFRAWQEYLAGLELSVIPTMRVSAEFDRALDMVQEWDEFLRKRGHVGEQFSLQEEVVRLHNWPGDQWDSGDDYASAQRRFHRRLAKARKQREDPVRDRVMFRALFLREGLLLNPVSDVEWFLAVCRFRFEVPEATDIRPELVSWRVLDWVTRLGREHRAKIRNDLPPWIGAADPRGVPAEVLTAVGGPGVMIDLDEDVVTALPPGCRVRRLIVSAKGPLGPDWTVYWVESEWDDSRPILDLVESAKLHPMVVFVSDEEPDDLAELIRPFLDEALEIPTNPLTAHSHSPGVIPRGYDFPDAGLS